jgi:hypothetical protein
MGSGAGGRGRRDRRSPAHIRPTKSLPFAFLELGCVPVCQRILSWP